MRRGHILSDDDLKLHAFFLRELGQKIISLGVLYGVPERLIEPLIEDIRVHARLLESKVGDDNEQQSATAPRAR